MLIYKIQCEPTVSVQTPITKTPIAAPASKPSKKKNCLNQIKEDLQFHDLSQRFTNA